jgi:hypothetical protein
VLAVDQFAIGGEADGIAGEGPVACGHVAGVCVAHVSGRSQAARTRRPSLHGA